MDRRLEWVQKNRVRRERVRPLGAALRRVADAVAAGNLPLDQTVRSAIAEVTDEVFRAHCRFRLSGGTLFVEVDPPGLLFSMRSQWLGPIEQALSRSGARRLAGRVRFEAGGRGESLSGEERHSQEDSQS